MDIWSWLKEVAILIVVYEITAAEGDLLESFRPKEENPPELNQFLHSVLEHKTDFDAVKQAARKYQKMKKDVGYFSYPEPFDNTLDIYTGYSGYKTDNKRHIPRHSPDRRFRSFDSLQPRLHHDKFHRFRRRIKKRMAEQALLKSEQRDEVKKSIPEEIIMLQSEDDSIEKRKPSPMVAQPRVSKSKKHIPSQIFIEPKPEPVAKRSPDEIVVESDGETGKVSEGDFKESLKEKKQAMDFNSAVHRTYKSHPANRMRNDMRNNKQGDFYYVDLENEAEKGMDRYNDKRRFGWLPRRPHFYYNRDGHRFRPYMGRPRPNADYPQYDLDPHHSLNDEVAFEKALSYELEPRSRMTEENYNNPDGNSLYSVDEGRPDSIEPLYPQSGYQARYQNGRYDYPPQDPDAVTNERFFIDENKNLKSVETTTTEGTTSTTTDNANKDGKSNEKILKQVGPGFIEIAKTRRDEPLIDDEPVALAKKSLDISEGEINAKENEQEKEVSEMDKQHSSILAKHSLHPLRVKDTSHEEAEEAVEANADEESLSRPLEAREIESREDADEAFKSRKLQFIDDEMANFYNQDEDYEEIPNRPRRDFLDALGMKNEEEYSEDNPYKDVIDSNNTDVHNDTHIHNATVKGHSCLPTTPRTTTTRHQKEDVKNIKNILEEQKDAGGTSNCKDKKEQSRPKKSSDFDDLFEGNDVREARDANKEMETKILQNKEKIYNPQGKFNNNHVQIRQERTMPKWQEDPAMKINKNDLKKSIKIAHKINKKEDIYSADLVTTPSSTTVCTDSENVNSTYEQAAHQMDVENEKLAQVVNGHLASKIVSTVFEELRKKNSLKAKFYSGLSRKHVNYAGTIDFDIFKANETEDVDEARLLLGQITKVLNRLVLNQIRRRLCQRLPDELRDYLDILLNVKNRLETSNFEPNTQQGDFLFTYQSDKPEPPFDVKKLQEIMVQLEALLLSYHNMNEDCQNRAEPVKEYIENHVNMLKQIVSCPSHTCDDNKQGEAKRDTPAFHSDLIEKQLESVGLGKRHQFIPNFDINQIIKTKLKDSGWKSDRKRDVQKSHKSQQYRRLQLAAERIREKRENDKKIGEMFGGKSKRSAKKPEIDYEEPVVYSLG